MAVPPVRLTTAESATATTPLPIEAPAGTGRFGLGVGAFGVVSVVEVQLVIGGAVFRIVSL